MVTKVRWFVEVFLSGLRRKARVRKCNRFSRQNGGHGPRRSIRRARKLGTRTQHCSLVTEFGVLRRKFWQVSCLICSSRIQRCRSFSERVGPRLIFLKSSQVSSYWKRSHEVTTEPITVLTKIGSQRLHVATAGRRCYYLERSKISHIAIK